MRHRWQEWYGSPLLPGVYNLTGAEEGEEYLFGDGDVPHYGSYRLVWISYIGGYVIIMDHEYDHEEFPGVLSVSTFRSYGPYDSWVRE